MSLTGTIRRHDRGPLGTVEEVKRHLADAFPGTTFRYVGSEPPGVSAIRWPLRARLLGAIFSVRTRYPHHSGLFERTLGDPCFVFRSQRAGPLDQSDLVRDDIGSR
jgi:hypothetical protein